MMTPHEPDWLEGDLERLAEQSLNRSRHVVTARRPGFVTIDGREYVDFASNDYLGLAADPRVAEGAAKRLERIGWGATASPLLTGYHQPHLELEERLAAWTGAEAVLLFPSGFGGNVGILSAIAGAEDVIFCDKRNHASLVDGCRLSGARLRVYRTGELDILEQRLGKEQARQRWIVTDSVFSMDGDVAPLERLTAIAERHDALLYLDEAHAIGVLGTTGGGLAEELDLRGRVPLRFGTFGKALGGVGGFLMTTRRWRDWLVNHCRSYIYSTALAPPNVAGVLEALDLLDREPQRRRAVLTRAKEIRERLAQLGFDVEKSRTPIVPVLAESSERVLLWAEWLREDGCWAAAIRPPTVPNGTARIRLSISAAHDQIAIERLFAAFGKIHCR
ncbi:8-amino-7-oxononanoate synthase [Kolteria novifilia]